MKNKGRVLLLISSLLLSSCFMNAKISDLNSTKVWTVNAKVSDGAISYSSNKAPMMSWSAPTDLGTAVLRSYEIALGTSPGAADAVPWTDVGNVLQYQFPSLSLLPGTTYYCSIRVKDMENNVSSAVVGNGFRSMAQKKLVDPVPVQSRMANASAQFGTGIAMSEDGLTLAVGARADATDANGYPSNGIGSVFVYTYNTTSSQWEFQQKISPTGAGAGGYFGYGISLYGNTLAISSQTHTYDENNSNPISGAGAVYIYTRSGGVWSLEQKIVPTGSNARVSGDSFGSALSLYSNTLVVGTGNHGYDSAGGSFLSSAGAVFVFTRSGSVWTQEAKITPTGLNNRLSSDRFGASVAVSGDTLIVGAPNQDYNAAGAGFLSNAGAAYVFTRALGVWTQRVKLIGTGANGRIGSDNFGSKVDVDEAFGTIAISATGQDYNAAGGALVNGAGAVYVFTGSGAAWALQQKVIATGVNARIASDGFGWGLDLDGDTLAAGSSVHQYDATGANAVIEAGAAFIFKRTGVTWNLENKIVAQGVNARTSYTYFGTNLAVNDSSNRSAMSSAYNGYDSTGTNYVQDAGAVFTYGRSVGVWTQSQKIVDTNTAKQRAGSKFSIFGNDVALSEDGKTMVVGAVNDNLNDQAGGYLVDAGSAYVFVKSGDNWVFQQKIVPSGTNARLGSDYFGYKVAISGDTIAVTSQTNEYDQNGLNQVNYAGAVFIFTRTAGVWTQQQKIVPSGVNARLANDYFGYDIDLSGDTLVASTIYQSYDENGANYVDSAGAVYIFTRTAGVWTQQQKIVSGGHANNRVNFDYFGTVVDIENDTLLVTAKGQSYDESGNNFSDTAGAAYIFTRTAGVWTQQKKIVATGLNARQDFDEFGTSAALSGKTIVIGVPNHSFDAAGVANGTARGALFVYNNNDNVWSLGQKIVLTDATDSEDNDGLGKSVDIDGDLIVATSMSHRHDMDGLNSVAGAGALFLFTKSSDTWVKQQKITPTGTNSRTTSDRYGNAITLKNYTIGVGAYWQDYDENGSYFVDAAGAVFVYH